MYLDVGALLKQQAVVKKNFYRSISENKEVCKYVIMMTSALSLLKSDIMEALQRYSDYSFLWEQDRQEAVTVNFNFLFHSLFLDGL